MNIKKLALVSITALLLAVLTAGCARFPTGLVPLSGKRIIVTMTVAGEIDPSYYYYVAFDTSGTSTPGPVPIVGKPWGNGWGTGKITHYVIFNQFQPQGGYTLYSFSPTDQYLESPKYIGAPVTFVRPPDGANKLQFSIDLNQLATDSMPADQIDLVNINFITTNILPVDSYADISNKYYDGLGSVGSSFISISVKTSQTYTNSQTSIEGSGDVRIPNLDIVDWTVEVQNR
jgi:hypothetical protein